MVGQMMMVLLGIMVFQSMLLLVGGVADADKRLVESKLLKWLRSGATSWCGGRDGLFWSAAILTVVCLRKPMEDPAV
jgi:hypothetical protein